MASLSNDPGCVSRIRAGVQAGFGRARGFHVPARAIPYIFRNNTVARQLIGGAGWLRISSESFRERSFRYDDMITTAERGV